MSLYTVTAANVLASSSAKRFQPNVIMPVAALATSARPAINVAGETITAGQPVYQDPTTLQFFLADADGAAPLYDVIGIAEHGAAIGQPLSVVTEDPYFTPGCTMLVGDVLILAGTVGRIAEAGDKASGWFVAVLMVAYTTTKASLKIVKSTAAKA